MPEIKYEIVEKIGVLSTTEKGWSKEFREMEETKLIETVRTYMENWLMIRGEADQIVILPAAGRLAGFYPEDFMGGTEN